MASPTNNIRAVHRIVENGVAENNGTAEDERTILDSNCSVCTEPLFSLGKRVAFLPDCRHHVHEDCLSRHFRTRQNGQDRPSRTCPTCHQPMRMGSLIRPVNYVIPVGTLPLQPQSIAMAKKLVQTLLWSTIAINAASVLDTILKRFLKEATFSSRHPLVRDSGMASCLASRSWSDCHRPAS